MNQTKKIEEANEHVKTAEKSLKTSLLKWRPDYEVAAEEYNKAATCYRNAKSYKQCKDCLLQAVECYKQNKSYFYAAKCIDQAIVICKETGDLEEVFSYAERSAQLYQVHGSIDTAAASLDKAAKILDNQYPERALQLFKHAAEIADTQDSFHQAAEYISRVTRLHVKLKQYDLAADSIRREIGLHQKSDSYRPIGRLAVALVLIQLARGDVVAAEKAFKEWGNYCEAPEVQTLEMLLQAYDEEDPEAAKRALNNPFIKHMDVEYAILARDLPLPQESSTPQTASVRENAAPLYVSRTSAAAQVDNEAESSPQESSPVQYEGSLC